MAGRQKEVIIDEVHQNQILRELYLKELRTQKLYTEYHVNPLRKVHTITRKPMSWHDNLEEPEDARFLNLLHHAALGPRKKYPETQTESQEIGWDSEPLNKKRKRKKWNRWTGKQKGIRWKLHPVSRKVKL
ncbi:protein FAM183A isoform X2 [Felis catus]|uniref:protein FAM183A isoform X2 n=1 Tax=Felis catus TaxID=9685 RepID=UPI001D19AE0A|nr:protein FAM183A isoform X2 [Felis catus]